jgi:hypothetical protein
LSLPVRLLWCAFPLGVFRFLAYVVFIRRFQLGSLIGFPLESFSLSVDSLPK